MQKHLWGNNEKTKFNPLFTLENEIANSDARSGLGAPFRTEKPNFTKIVEKSGKSATRRLVIFKSVS
ncbi:MAG: hypothetical protein GY820_42410 [Gammaproteobacteria bacterium]|nr:hypothetical protein [Gammaproteobacteria bacterium]